MPTYGDLKQSIINSLNRDDLVDDCAAFAAERIRHYQRDFFYSTPVTIRAADTGGITTVRGQAFYPTPDNVVGVKYLRLNYQSVWQMLVETEYERLLRSDVNIPPVVAPPTSWAPYDAMIRLFPAPDKAYELEITGSGKIPVPADDDTENFWTKDAAGLIMYATLARLYLVRIHSPDYFEQCARAEQDARISLVRETWEKSTERRVVGHW